MKRNMVKKVLLFALIISILVSGIPALAASESEPAIYKETITVTEDGGRYQVGFAEVEFKKEYIAEEELPITFEVQIYAENGQAYIEFNPDVPEFDKKVHIRIKKYNGLLYDRATGENINVELKTQQVLAEHFSRYIFHR